MTLETFRQIARDLKQICLWNGQYADEWSRWLEALGERAADMETDALERQAIRAGVLSPLQWRYSCSRCAAFASWLEEIQEVTPEASEVVSRLLHSLEVFADRTEAIQKGRPTPSSVSAYEDAEVERMLTSPERAHELSRLMEEERLREEAERQAADHRAQFQARLREEESRLDALAGSGPDSRRTWHGRL